MDPCFTARAWLYPFRREHFFMESLESIEIDTESERYLDAYERAVIEREY